MLKIGFDIFLYMIDIILNIVLLMSDNNKVYIIIKRFNNIYYLF